MKKKLSMRNRMIWEKGIYGVICCIGSLLYMRDGRVSLVFGGIAILLLLLFEFYDRRIEKEKHDEMSEKNLVESFCTAQTFTWVIFIVVGVGVSIGIIPPLSTCTTVVLMMGVSKIIQCKLFIKYEKEGI